MLVRFGPLIAAAALVAACSSSNKETRTAENQAGASQSGATATAQGTPVRESPATGSATDIATSNSSRGMSSASGQVASVDPDAGSIALDQGTGPAIVVIIDDDTAFVDSRGQAMSEGISGIHEGQQVRTSLDPNSHHADQIQVTKEGKADWSRRQQQDQELLQEKPKQ